MENMKLMVLICKDYANTALKFGNYLSIFQIYLYVLFIAL